MSAAIRMYDLAGIEDERRFSPHCWRVKMAMKHKGLEFDALPWRFTEKETIAFSKQGLVPVIVDGERVVNDSWAIVQYLDATYPDRPALLEGEHARGSTQALKFWVDRVVHTALVRVIMLDLFAHVHPKDKAYFRETREKRYGVTLEELAGKPAESLAALRTTLDPVRLVLETQPFLGGSKPSYADYMLFGTFQWARCVSPIKLLEASDPVHAWRERMLDLFGGYARSALGYPA